MSTIPAGLCQCGCGGKTTVPKWMDRAANQFKGVPLPFIKGHNFRLNKSGPESNNWKGGRYLSSEGYVVIQTPEGRKYEHIMLAEKALGRPLPQYGKGDGRNMVVHHIDGNKQNNAPDNLLICTHSYHTALHHRLEQSEAWPEFPKVVRNVGPQSK